MANIFNRIFGNTPKNEVKNVQGNNLQKYVNSYSFSSRISQDIKNWREAVYEAEQNSQKYRVKMQQMYRDTVLNGHVKACLNRRKNLTLLNDFTYENLDGTQNEEVTKMFQKKWFFDTIEYVLDAKFYGYSVINWTSIENGYPANIQIINRENINPDGNFISQFPYSNSGTDINSPELSNWSLYCKTNSEHGISNCGYGLLYEVAIYEIILRNNLGYNNDFVERFGQPVIIADTMKTDEDERGYLEDMLSNIGSSGVIIKDSTDNIQYLEYSKAGDGYTGYDNLEQRCEKKVSKLLLGHADALDSTPGKLGGTQGDLSPQQLALNEIKTIDSNYIEYYVNDYLIGKLRKLGFKIPEGKFKFENNSEKALKAEKELSKRERTAMYLKTLTEAGISVDLKWVSEELEIPLAQTQPTQKETKPKKLK